MKSGVHQAMEQQMWPLSEVSAGKTVTVQTFRGGKGMRQRLLDLGIVPGEQVKIVRGGKGLPFVLMVKTSKVMLGQGIASHILVSEDSSTTEQ